MLKLMAVCGNLTAVGPHAKACGCQKWGDMKSRVIIILAALTMAPGASHFPARAQEDPSGGSHQKSVWDGVYTEEQARRGKTSYLEKCANCHGPSLAGAGEALPIVGSAFTAKWNGLTVGDLLERMRTTMPLDRPGSVGRRENVHILAYILKVNEFPPGETELPRRTSMLKQILFLAAKP